MANDGVRIPMGSGGLVRYDEASHSKFQIKPEYVVVMIAAVVIFEFVLKFIIKS